jgi:4a-hydroxytetrahydrobiopterin dehydratase
MTLAQKSCIPCQGGIPPLGRDKAQAYLAQTPGWTLDDGATRISRTFKFKNFKQSQAFVNAVGDAAEAQGHHPDITFGWGYATVVFFTHKVKGLHENDFIMAAKTNDLYDQSAA